jgi:regulator of cell morphogenesis and NO signaling
VEVDDIMNLLDKNTTIGGIVAELPKASQVFGEFGIDFCCGGHRKLYDVINEQGIDEKGIYEALQLAQQERSDSYKEHNFTDMSPSVLTDYIEDTHHSYTRHALIDITELLSTIIRVHGKNHKELFEVYRLFGALKTDLEQHLIKEETMLFPALAQMDGDQEEILGIATDIIKEHEAAGEVLVELRLVTKDYNLPEDACGTYRRAYEMLEELEKDLHQHIHLENNILLKEYDKRL